MKKGEAILHNLKFPTETPQVEDESPLRCPAGTLNFNIDLLDLKRLLIFPPIFSYVGLTLSVHYYYIFFLNQPIAAQHSPLFQTCVSYLHPSYSHNFFLVSLQHIITPNILLLTTHKCFLSLYCPTVSCTIDLKKYIEHLCYSKKTLALKIM